MDSSQNSLLHEQIRAFALIFYRNMLDSLTCVQSAINDLIFHNIIRYTFADRKNKKEAILRRDATPYFWIY